MNIKMFVKINFLIIWMVLGCSCQNKRTRVELPTLKNDSVSIEEIVVKEMKIYNLDSCLYPSLNSFIDSVKTLPQYANREFFIYMDWHPSLREDDDELEMLLEAPLESDRWFYRDCDCLVRYKGYDIFPVHFSDSFPYINDTGQYDTLKFTKTKLTGADEIEEYLVIVIFK